MTTNIKAIDKIYSYSRLSLFEQCQRAFYHKYIELRPDPSGMPAKIGKIFHLALELIINEGFAPEDAVNFAIYENNGLPEGETVLNMISMVKRAFHRIQQLHSEYVDIVSELHLKVKTEKGTIQGFLDLVVDDPANDEIELWDFKTTWSPFTAKESKQLHLYAWMYKQMRGGIVAGRFKGKLIFPRRAEFEDSEVIFTDESIEDAYQWAANTIETIESKDPHNISEWNMTTDRTTCEHCPFSTLCSGGFINNLPGDGIPKDEAEAMAIGDFIRMQEVAIKRMKDGLKKYVKTNGPVATQGGRWEFVQSEPSPKLSIDILKKYAEDHELDFNDVLKIDSTILKKWIKEDSTGYLKSQAKWTSPRSTFRFIEVDLPDPEKKGEAGHE